MRFPASRSLPALMLTALVLAAAGCGGGEVDAGEVPGSPPALTVRSDSELGAAADASADENGADAASADATATPEPEATVAPSGTTAPETRRPRKPPPQARSSHRRDPRRSSSRASASRTPAPAEADRRGSPRVASDWRAQGIKALRPGPI